MAQQRRWLTILAGLAVAVGTVSQPASGASASNPDPVGVTAAEPGTVTQVATGTDVPWGVAVLDEQTILVSERNSFQVFRLTRSGQRVAAGTVPNTVTTNGEGGLLGLAVSPTFASDRWLYIYHTAAEGNRIARMRYESDKLVSGSYQVLVRGISQSRYHNGGRLRFGPDGKLYAATGDAQDTSKAQNLNSLNGKILRLNPDGTVPADNPYSGSLVWSYGHRNVQGLAFDSRNRLWASEFGNSTMDELNLITKGGNYGWPNCEGTSGSCGGNGFIAPVRTFAPTSSNSPSGITIVDDYIFMAQTTGQRVYRMQISGNTVGTPKAYFERQYNRLRTVERTPAGDLWLTTTTDKDGVANNDRIFFIELN